MEYYWAWPDMPNLLNFIKLPASEVGRMLRIQNIPELVTFTFAMLTLECMLKPTFLAGRTVVLAQIRCLPNILTTLLVPQAVWGSMTVAAHLSRLTGQLAHQSVVVLIRLPVQKTCWLLQLCPTMPRHF